MAFIKHIWLKHKKKISVIACETEPLEQGIRTARELADEKIPVTLIDDNAIGFFIKDVDMVIVGADAMRINGVVNKIGTSLLAQSAKANGKPFYVIANLMKIDRRKKLKIEERSPKEIYRKIINKSKLKNVKIRNPAFDITPWKYVTAVVNEKGIANPQRIARMAGKD
jgi:ribose 1,5-bisphosphate isomerase